MCSANPEIKKIKGCLRVQNKVFLRYFTVALHLCRSRQQNCSLHLLTLQSGSCEFSANDSGRWSSELRMEMGCGPNRAWSIRSSSPGLFDSRWFVASWDSILCLSWLPVPRHCGGSKCLMGTKINPLLFLLPVQLTSWPWQKRASRRAACNNHQSCS